MTTVIISIKPEYVEKIFSGEKKWEFRKCRITADKFLIYETAPTSKIVGEFTPRWVGEGTPEAIYAETCLDGAGIDYDKFFEYFKGHKTAFAYEITNLKKYEFAVPLAHYGFKRPPLSFCYLQKDGEA